MRGLTNSIKALHPFAKHATVDESRRAARLGSVALIGTALQSLISTVFQHSNPEDLKALMMRAEGPVSLEDAIVAEKLYSQIVPIVTMMLWVVMVLTIMVCGVLAWVQWRKLTKIIPLVYLGVAGIGLMSAVVTVMDPNTRVLAQSSAGTVQVVVTVVLAVIMFTAYRGASQYHALQGDRT